MSAVEWTDAEREAAAGALRKSRLTWGTHSDRWSDTPWQRDFWGEAADITLAALAPHVAALVRAERAAALREAADDLEELVDDQHPVAANPDQWLRDRAEAEEADR